MKTNKHLRAFLLTLFLVLAASVSANAATSTFNAYKKAVSSGSVGAGKFVKKNGKIRYRLSNGKYVKSRWAIINKKVYAFDKYGYVRSGRFTVGDNVYRTDKNGAVYRNKRYVVGKTVYYFGPTCAMVKGAWAKIGSGNYYFKSNGRMAVSTWVGDLYVDNTGKAVTGLSKKKILSRASDSEIAKESRLIIVGASRCVQMASATGTAAFKANGITWHPAYIAKSGAAYNWFSTVAIHKLRAYLTLFPNSKVVLQMGNNDLHSTSSMNIKKYVSAYRALMKQFPKAQFYMMDALPSRVASENQARATFNRKLKSAFPKNYIGGFSYLMKTGFVTRSATDTTHYNKATYRKIFNYILNQTGLR